MSDIENERDWVDPSLRVVWYTKMVKSEITAFNHSTCAGLITVVFKMIYSIGMHQRKILSCKSQKSWIIFRFRKKNVLAIFQFFKALEMVW